MERTEALQLLEQLLDEALDGTGQVVSITGPTGSGKTELANQLATRAGDQGIRVLQTYASRAGVVAAPGIFGQLLEACTSSALLRRLTMAAPADIRSPQFILGICHELLRSAARTPLLLIADDVHLADADSFQGLLYLIRHVRTAPVMLVLVVSEYSQQTIPLFHAELFREPHHRQIHLQPLSEAGVTGVLADRLDEATARRLAPATLAASGGNPLVVRALVEEHLTQFTEPDKEPLSPGEASATAVLACLHHSGQPCLEVARAIALLGGRVAPELISRLVSMPRFLVERYTTELSEAGLLGPDGMLRHPAAHCVILSDPDFDDAAELHHRAAELLHSEGETALRIAEHLIAADRAGRHWQIPVLRQAAEDALEEGKADLSLQCLDLALRDCPESRERALITAAKVRVEWRMNPARALSHFAGLLSAFEQGHLPDLEAIMLARALMWHGREGEAAAILTTIGSRAHTAEVREALISTEYSLSRTHPGAVAVWRGAPAQLRLQGDELGAAVPTEAGIWSLLQEGDHAASSRRAEELLRADLAPDYWRGPHANALCALLYAHELKRAEYWTTRIYQDGEPEGFRTWQAVQSVILSEIARRRGDLPEAARLAEEGLCLMGPRAWGPQIVLPLATLISTAAAAGHGRVAEQWLSCPLPELVPKTRYYLHYLEAVGQYHLAEGRHLLALRNFLACGRQMKRWGMDLPGIASWRLGVAEALLGLGQTERAVKMLDEQAEQPGAQYPRVHGRVLRLRAATVKPRQAVALLRESADLLDRDQLPVELLATLIDLNRCYAELGDSHRARFTARRIWQIAARCGAEALVRRSLLPEFAAPGVVAGAVSRAAEDDVYTVLSDAELRVAELAVRGHTNREIAARLYITVSTVEQHLTRVYRKLRVGGRADLQSRLDPKLRGTA
ncbi:AAA family ATPase [Streptomyces sp. NPDC056672]|uniref:AAA family ATPase n=1 Tax=Streptomyces sp. NPDC056672 TaxID=3345906 RepID=UPI0036C710EF